ncbi:MAG: histidine phosphatase family protein [Betaproteobacteria bacterium]
MANRITLYFMRHGWSEADDENVHGGRYDDALTAKGRAQVLARAQDFAARNIKFDSIVASTLRRAHQSALIVAQTLGGTVDTDPDWMEFDNGALAGLSFDEAAKRYPVPAFRNPYESFHGTGESDVDIQMRATRALQNVVRRGPGCHLVVAHGGILNAVMRVIVGAPPVLNGKHGIAFWFRDATYARVHYYPADHYWALAEIVDELPSPDSDE